MSEGGFIRDGQQRFSLLGAYGQYASLSPAVQRRLLTECP